MPDAYFLLFELIIYLQLVLCIAHARKHGPGGLIRLFSAIIFGLLLELGTLRELNAYHYGRFLIMILNVPLCIAVAWGNIVYSVMEFSDATNLPRWARPLLDGLLALNIDLALDTVAIRLGLWDWGAGLQFQFFGVPYANFLAWFWVVAAFSYGFRLPAHRQHGSSAWLAGLSGIIVGLVVVLITNAFMAYLLPVRFHFLPTLLIPLLAVLFIASQQPRFHTRSVAPVSLLVPLSTLLYVLVAGWVSGIFTEIPALLWITAAMLLLLFLLHWPTLLRMLTARPNMRKSHST